MIKRTGLFVTILLSAIMLQVIQLESQAFNFLQSKLATGKASAGVGGVIPGDQYIGARIGPAILCKSEKCTATYNEVVQTYSNITDIDNQISTLIKNSTNPEIVKLRDEIDNMTSNIQKIDPLTSMAQTDLMKEQLKDKMNTLQSVAISNDTNIKTFFDSFESKWNEFETLITRYQEENAEYQDLQDEKDHSTPDEPSEPDQTDCHKQSMGQFPNGELIAWGIPGFGGFSIPDSAASSKKDKNITEANVSNKTMQSLKVVEDNSEKVTQEEIGTFLQDLDNPDANLN